MQKISLGFISQCYFSVLKDARLNLTHYLVMKTDTTLPVSDLLRFKKNLFHSYKNGSS